MQSTSPFRLRNWVIFILINILISTATAFLVVRSLTQAASRATIAQPTTIAAIDSPLAAIAPTTELPAAVSETQATATNLPEAGAPQPQATTDAASAPTAAPTSTIAEKADVRISTVVYPGQRTREAVVIVNEGSQVDMTGWTLSNPRGKIYTFGSVVLFKDSFINLHSTKGVDVPTDLFWNLDEAAWQAGDAATLKRGDELMATFTVK